MKTKIYFSNEKFIAGITLRDESEPESNNMALHACHDPNNIVENRKKLASFLNCSLNDFVCSNQTHSSNFYQVKSSDKGRGSDTMDTAIKDTDALFTYEPNLLLCCFTSDCVPVILHDPVTGLIGTIHSGWQGTVKEITLKVLDHIIHKELCNPNDLNIYIGSAISQEKFEVDELVYDQFKDLGYANDFIYFYTKTGKYHIDNQQVVRKQCELQGIPAEKIKIDKTCTYRNPDSFSYRQDKNCGRHLSFIMAK